MKMLHFICYLILLLVTDVESRSTPGMDIDANAIIRCKVYVDNFTRVQTFHSSIKGSSVRKSKNTRKDAKVSVKAILQGTNNTSASGPALLIGGFGILVIEHNSLQLNLTPNSNKSVITISGNTDIEVQVQGQDRLLITPISGDNYHVLAAGRAEYEIRVLSYDEFKDEVTISLNYETFTSIHNNHLVFYRLGGFLFIIELAVIIRYRKRFCNGNH